MSKRVLVAITVASILLTSIVSLSAATAKYIAEMIFGTLLGWIPYIATLLVGKDWKASSRLSLAGGLLLYLIIDLDVRYRVLHTPPTSSTEGVAMMVALVLSAIIIPAGAIATYLIIRAGQAIVRKGFRR